MASGNVLGVFSPLASCGPASTAAQFDTIAGASTPAEAVPVLAFDSTTAEYADFYGVLPAHYAGGGLTLTFKHSCGTATGGVTYRAAFRRIQEDAEDLDTTAFTYDFNDVDIATLPSAAGEVNFDDITFTSGADMDSLAAGEPFILRIARNPADANDTAAADARVHMLYLKET